MDIPNGACLQLGIGGMPNVVGSLIAKSDLKDLGIHTEMYVDSFVVLPLYKTKNGEIKSGILPSLVQGTIITDTRTSVHYLVTEYGKVN